jgi:hypothetical protein
MHSLVYACFALAVLLLAAVPFGCQKPADPVPDPTTPGQTDPGSTPGPSKEGLVCPVGAVLPEAGVVSQTIGPAGGELQSADGRLKLVFPAGALATAQTVSVQAIANTSPSGVGVGYRLLPDGATFAKPVSLTFTYDEAELRGTVAGALTVGFQNKKGVWVAVSGTQVNPTTRTVTAQTTHFTDWMLGKLAWVLPRQTVMDPGSTLEFKLIGYTDEQLAAYNRGDLELPAPGELSQGVRWELGGPGQLRDNGSRATYTAPGQVPAVNPVAISTRFRQGGHEFLVVSNVYIGREGLSIRVDGGPWLTSGPAPLGAVTVGKYVQAVFAPFLNGKFAGTATVRWFDGQYNGATFTYNKKLEYVNFVNENSTVEYFTFQAVANGVRFSPGALEVYDSGKSGEYVVGSFYLDRAGRLLVGSTSGMTTARIEGFFKVKRK